MPVQNVDTGLADYLAQLAYYKAGGGERTFPQQAGALSQSILGLAGQLQGLTTNQLAQKKLELANQEAESKLEPVTQTLGVQGQDELKYRQQRLNQNPPPQSIVAPGSTPDDAIKNMQAAMQNMPKDSPTYQYLLDKINQVSGQKVLQGQADTEKTSLTNDTATTTKALADVGLPPTFQGDLGQGLDVQKMKLYGGKLGQIQNQANDKLYVNVQTNDIRTSIAELPPEQQALYKAVNTKDAVGLMGKTAANDSRETIAGMKAKQLEVKEKQLENTVESLGEAIVKGQFPPDVRLLGGGMSGKGIEVAKYIAQNHPEFDYQGALKQWKADTQLISTMNQNQQVGLKQSLDTVNREIPIMEGLNNDFQRTGFSPANKVILGAALRGITFLDKDNNPRTEQIKDYELDPSAVKDMNENQAQVAAKFISQINLMKDNIAVAFMRGGVPSDRAFQLADDIVNPLYSNPLFGSAMEQVKKNIGIRMDIRNENTGFVPPSKANRGGTSNVKPPKNTDVSKVIVQDKNGKQYKLPVNQVAEALKQGYERVP